MIPQYHPKKNSNRIWTRVEERKAKIELLLILLKKTEITKQEEQYFNNKKLTEKPGNNVGNHFWKTTKILCSFMFDFDKVNSIEIRDFVQLANLICNNKTKQQANILLNH